MTGLRSRIPGLRSPDSGITISGLLVSTGPVWLSGHALPVDVPLIGAAGMLVEAEHDGSLGSIRVEFSPDPTRPDAEVLRELAELQDATADQLRRESPIGLAGEEVEFLPRERELEENIERLAQVCAEPRTRLATRREIVSVERARRIDGASINWVASHPAAWSGRNSRGPVPSRVLADQPHVVIDFYENRVAATLVDTIHSHLLDRIRGLEIVDRRIADKRQIEANGGWRMRNRVATLWAESWIGDEDLGRSSEQLQSVLRRLRVRSRQLAVLKQRSGYDGVPPARRRVKHLVQTNIFRGDDRYHGVARLWAAFEKRAEQSIAQDVERQLATLSGFETFVRLLLVRSVESALWSDLLDPLDEASGATLMRDHDHTIRLVAPGAPDLTVVPLYCAAAPINIGSMLDVVEEHLLIMILPPGDSPTASAWVGSQGRARVIAESPADLGAVEAVGAALRGHVLGARYRALPPVATLPQDIGRMLRSAGARLTPLAVDGPHERSALLGPASTATVERARAAWLPPDLRRGVHDSRERVWRSVMRDLQAAERRP